MESSDCTVHELMNTRTSIVYKLKDLIIS